MELLGNSKIAKQYKKTDSFQIPLAKKKKYDEKMNEQNFSQKHIKLVEPSGFGTFRIERQVVLQYPHTTEKPINKLDNVVITKFSNDQGIVIYNLTQDAISNLPTDQASLEKLAI